MTQFYLGKRSLTRLHKLHPKMAACVALAITFLEEVDISVSETVRTNERQHKLYYGKPKRTWTLNSKHLIQDDGFCHAVDLIPLLAGKVVWDKCPVVAEAMFKAAKIIGIRIRWGGDWNQNGSSKDEHKRGSYDGPHFEFLSE